jgi:cytochrome c peroxidase
MRNQYDGPRDTDRVSLRALATLLAAMLIFALFMGSRTAPRFDDPSTDQQSEQLRARLFGDHRAGLQALVASAGYSCHHVCGIKATGESGLRVSCGADWTTQPCTLTQTYILTIDREIAPSR